MADAQALTVRRVPPELAASALAGLSGLDPRGLLREADILAMCQGGQCFAVEGESSAVYVLSVGNGTAWVQAAAGSGAVDLTALLDGVITAQAQGLGAVACQTARPGLVRKLKRHGYHVAGWIMRKELQCLQ